MKKVNLNFKIIQNLNLFVLKSTKCINGKYILNKVGLIGLTVHQFLINTQNVQNDLQVSHAMSVHLKIYKVIQKMLSHRIIYAVKHRLEEYVIRYVTKIANCGFSQTTILLAPNLLVPSLNLLVPNTALVVPHLVTNKFKEGEIFMPSGTIEPVDFKHYAIGFDNGNNGYTYFGYYSTKPSGLQRNGLWGPNHILSSVKIDGHELWRSPGGNETRNLGVNHPRYSEYVKKFLENGWTRHLEDIQYFREAPYFIEVSNNDGQNKVFCNIQNFTANLDRALKLNQLKIVDILQNMRTKSLETVAYTPEQTTAHLNKIRIYNAGIDIKSPLNRVKEVIKPHKYKPDEEDVRRVRAALLQRAQEKLLLNNDFGNRDITTFWKETQKNLDEYEIAK